MLVRKGSQKKLDALREHWGADDKQVIAVVGDLAKQEPRRRPTPTLKKLKGKIEHFFHLAAIYDLQGVAPKRSRSPTSRARATRSSSPTPSTRAASIT